MNGLEAWRRLHRRWDRSSGTRKCALLQAILDPGPGRSSMEDLTGNLEKWLQQVQRYERRKDALGHRKTMDEDIKIASLVTLVPAKIKNHNETNGHRLQTWEQVLHEVEGMIELYIGSEVYDIRATASGHKDPNAMDVDSLTKGNPKGKGKGAKGAGGGYKGVGGGGQGGGKDAQAQSQGYCDFCWKWGHKKQGCLKNPDSPNYVKPTSSPVKAAPKSDASGKGEGLKGKGKGKARKAKELKVRRLKVNGPREAKEQAENQKQKKQVSFAA